MVICDLTQSYAPYGGGGVSCYLREKRRHILARTDHTLIQIVPGPEDRIIRNGRHIWVEVAAGQVQGSPNYRFILRTSAVRAILERFRPDVIESLCPWVLPWTAINYRRAHPHTALVAGYHTDFPNTHVHRVGAHLFGDTMGGWLRQVSINYAEITYRNFDRVYALDAATERALHDFGIAHVDVLDLGVDADLFNPIRRDRDRWKALGLPTAGPVLVYSGRIDVERRADRLVEMFRYLPDGLGASLVMLGDGKLREALIAATAGMRVRLPGFIEDRAELAVALASADIYVSAMAAETFGLSVVEAQASGLPVVGVASGAMPARVTAGLGLLGPTDDMAAMADNVQRVWHGDHTAMGRAARLSAASRYSWNHVFDRLLGEVYANALMAARSRVERSQRNWGWLMTITEQKRRRA
jgi:glycosyltransferase involved in cell wall biosynthesis